ncbi:MAG TPA: helix-turn-helix transcriptional regulator, partial [Microthrixaceae bacterium]|nr:helix-turn-helix transcriptional regulator [Microthrixaceae bacterium]
VRAVGLALLALLALQDGELATAVTLSRSARSTADAHGLECFAPAISVYAVDALVAANDRRPGDARAAAAIAGATVERLGDLSPRTALLALILLARTAVAVGDRREARRLLGEAQEARRRDSSASALNAQLAELESCLGSGRDLDRVDVEALTVAEQRVLELLPTHLPQGMIASELHVSRNTVKTHAASIYRKLGVTSRADAVDVARSVGLLA